MLYLGFLKIGYVIWFRFMVERGNIKKEKYFIFSYVWESLFLKICKIFLLI